MKKLDFLIVDDVEANAQFLHLLMDKYCSEAVNDITEVNTVEAAIEHLEVHSIDVLFLDIELNDKNGFDLLESLNEINFHIVFVTAFDHYAIKAFKYGAFDYLLKPIAIQELTSCVSRIFQEKKPTIGLDEVKKLIASIHPSSKTLSITSQTAIDIIQLSELVRCKADGRYTDCILSDGRRIVSSKSLKEFEELLPDHEFIRVHHGDIVNIKHIKQILKRKNGILRLSNGDEIEIAQRRRSVFNEIIERLK